MNEEKQDDGALGKFIEDEIALLRGVRDRIVERLKVLTATPEHRHLLNAGLKVDDAIQKLGAHPALVIKPPADPWEGDGARVTIGADDVGKLHLRDLAGSDQPKPEVIDASAESSAANAAEAKQMADTGKKN